MNKIPSRKLTALGCIAAGVVLGTPAFAAQQLEEVIVSATFRDTQLMDTPLTMSALTAQDITERGFEDVSDLYKGVPGLSYISQAASFNTLTIRGLTPPAGGAAMVSVYIDNMPITDNFAGGSRQVMGEMYDMNRVEVLKGPQGTLYGEGSMGGSVRYITEKPDPEALDFSVQGRIDDARYSSGLSYTVNGMVNIPLGETLALRVVGVKRDRKGVLDAVGPLNQKDVDFYEQYGARAILQWQPTDTLTVTGLINTSRADFGGTSTAVHCNSEVTLTNPVGRLPAYALPPGSCLTTQSERFNRGGGAPYITHFSADGLGTGGFDDLDMYNLSIDWDMPFATLTSSTTYYEREVTVSAEAAGNSARTVSGLAAFIPFPGLDQVDAVGSDGANYGDRERFVQEFRLVSNSDGPLNWTAGVYYKKDESQDSEVGGCFNNGNFAAQNLPDGPCQLQLGFADGVDQATQEAVHLFIVGAIFGPALGSNFSKYTEKSIFGEVSYQFNEQWELLVGGRYAQVTNGLKVAQLGLNTPTDPVNSLKTDTNVFSPKATLTWRPNQDWMVYATVAHGFRPGSLNVALAGLVASLEAVSMTNPAAIPEFERLRGFQELDSDEVINYELGVKATLADGRVSFTGALYRIEWTDTLVNVTEPGPQFEGVNPLDFSYQLNSGEAESEGIELEVRAALTDSVQLAIGGDYIWTAQILTAGTGKFFGAGFGPGNRLPNAPETSLYASLTYDFTLGGMEATARADAYHVGGEKYFGIDNEEETPSFETLDIKLLLRRDNWNFSVFVSNLTDEAQAFELNPNGYILGRPRSVGAQVSYNFL